MQNNIILLLFVIVVVYLATRRETEGFSTSGLNMSDEYCNKLVSGYHDPQNDNELDKLVNNLRICSPLRKYAIDPQTGNSFTYYNKLM